MTRHQVGLFGDAVETLGRGQRACDRAPVTNRGLAGRPSQPDEPVPERGRAVAMHPNGAGRGAPEHGLQALQPDESCRRQGNFRSDLPVFETLVD